MNLLAKEAPGINPVAWTVKRSRRHQRRGKRQPAELRSPPSPGTPAPCSPDSTIPDPTPFHPVTVTSPTTHYRITGQKGGDEENPSLDIELADDFKQLLGAAVHYRIATGPHAGRKALTLRTVGPSPPPDNPCIAQLSGFYLHAGTDPEQTVKPRKGRMIRIPLKTQGKGHSSTTSNVDGRKHRSLTWSSVNRSRPGKLAPVSMFQRLARRSTSSTTK